MAGKDDIISFADIGDHIDQPVRTYSSGMKARLGFSVSVSVDPDILIVDEVLAVGDDIFKLKCIEKMEQFRREGKTILFVSHSLFTVKAFCTKALWIDDGVVMDYGELGDNENSAGNKPKNRGEPMADFCRTRFGTFGFCVIAWFRLYCAVSAL